MGQRQRIALARAALRQAPLLVLDEPTSSLDKANRDAVLEALRDISAGRTTFMITHILQEIEHADIILHIENGILIESGSHIDLMAANGTYASLVNSEYIRQMGLK